MSATFCPIPWIFQAVRNNGDIRVCCQANVTRNKGVVRHEDGTPFNASRDSLEEARNAKLMRDVRLNMINGVWSEECGRCKSEEENGLVSRRMYESENWNFSVDDAKKIIDKDGFIHNHRVRYYDLRFGNLCNLACRMCGPTDSHQWYDQWLGYYGGNSFFDTHGEVSLSKNENGRLFTTDYDWHNSQIFWQNLEGNIEHIRHVYLAGGEPMMISRHYEFLEKCIKADSAKNIIIEYNTNMTSLPPRVTSLWEKFKQVRVGASIDGVGLIHEYQRWPANWEKTYSNLQKLDELASKNKNIICWMAVTVTVYNVWHIPEMMWWKIQSSNFKSINTTSRRPVITHHVAHHPKHLNIRVLPESLKNQLKQHYEMWQNKFNESSISENTKNKAISILKSISSYMLSDSYYSTDFNRFISFTKYLDAQRNQNIVNVIPEYKDVFNV